MFFIDSHCHLDKTTQMLRKDISEITYHSNLNNIKAFLSVCTAISDLKEMFEISKKEKNIFLSCGIHPLNVNEFIDFNFIQLVGKSKNVVAIGETGLDFLKENNKVLQEESFIKHILISKNLKKPIIVHSRNSSTETINILKNEKNNFLKGVLHCFNYDKNTARKLLDLGFYISFSGIITFNNAHDLRDTLHYIPIESILIETDSPYLTPTPNRGKINQPAYLKYIAKSVSLIKNIPIEIVAEKTTKNFIKLFNIEM